MSADPTNNSPIPLGKVIASGAYSQVYKVDASTAVKVTKYSDFSSAAREVIFVNKMNHPNIIKFTRTEIDSCYNVICSMKYYVHSLEGYKYLNISKILSIFTDILSGINHLHQHGVIHCDIKSTNILYDGTTAVICDFNNSNIIRADNKYPSKVQTVYYRAPEVDFSKTSHCSYNEKIDIWSAGCILYECLNCNVGGHHLLRKFNRWDENDTTITACTRFDLDTGGNKVDRLKRLCVLPREHRHALINRLLKDEFFKFRDAAEWLSRISAIIDLIASCLCPDVSARFTAQQALCECSKITTIPLRNDSLEQDVTLANIIQGSSISRSTLPAKTTDLAILEIKSLMSDSCSGLLDKMKLNIVVPGLRLCRIIRNNCACKKASRLAAVDKVSSETPKCNICKIPPALLETICIYISCVLYNKESEYIIVLGQKKKTLIVGLTAVLKLFNFRLFDHMF
jgi:serine/threonine protein kinase